MGGIDYIHRPELAPTQELLDAFKKHKGSWASYERDFSALISKRGIETSLTRDVANWGCLLCSEKKPDHCHRRLVAESLQKHWGEVCVRHLD